MFQFSEQFDLKKYDISFSSIGSFFLIEFLKTTALSCIFSEFAGMLFQNVGLLIEILYIELLNLNDGILSLTVEKFLDTYELVYRTCVEISLVLFEIRF